MREGKEFSDNMGTSNIIYILRIDLIIIQTYTREYFMI